MSLSERAVDTVFAKPALGFVLWFKPPGRGKRWVKISTHATRALCVRDMNASGDYRITEIGADAPADVEPPNAVQ